jgi:hypothetical protein
VTLGTVLHRTRVPLTVWSWAAYLVTTHTPGLSAVQLQRQLGVSYEGTDLSGEPGPTSTAPTTNTLSSSWRPALQAGSGTTQVSLIHFDPYPSTALARG